MIFDLNNRDVGTNGIRPQKVKIGAFFRHFTGRQATIPIVVDVFRFEEQYTPSIVYEELVFGNQILIDHVQAQQIIDAVIIGSDNIGDDEKRIWIKLSPSYVDAIPAFTSIERHRRVDQP